MPEFDYIRNFADLYTMGYLGGVCVAVLEKSQYYKLTSSSQHSADLFRNKNQSGKIDWHHAFYKRAQRKQGISNIHT